MCNRWSKDSSWYAFFNTYSGETKKVLSLWNKNSKKIPDLTYSDIVSEDFNLKSYYDCEITESELNSAQEIITSYKQMVEEHEL